MSPQSSALPNSAESIPHLTEPNQPVTALRNRNGVRAQVEFCPSIQRVVLMFGTEDLLFYQGLKLKPEEAATLGRLLIEGAAFFGVTQ